VLNESNLKSLSRSRIEQIIEKPKLLLKVFLKTDLSSNFSFLKKLIKVAVSEIIRFKVSRKSKTKMVFE
jgi:hypothetical protein